MASKFLFRTRQLCNAGKCFLLPTFSPQNPTFSSEEWFPTPLSQDVIKGSSMDENETASETKRVGA